MLTWMRDAVDALRSVVPNGPEDAPGDAPNGPERVGQRASRDANAPRPEPRRARSSQKVLISRGFAHRRRRRGIQGCWRPLGGRQNGSQGPLRRCWKGVEGAADGGPRAPGAPQAASAEIRVIGLVGTRPPPGGPLDTDEGGHPRRARAVMTACRPRASFGGGIPRTSELAKCSRGTAAFSVRCSRATLKWAAGQCLLQCPLAVAVLCDTTSDAFAPGRVGHGQPVTSFHSRGGVFRCVGRRGATRRR